MKTVALRRGGTVVGLSFLLVAALNHSAPGTPPAGAALQPVPTTATTVTWDGRGQAPCPEGNTRAASFRTEDFTSTLPQSRFVRGFQRVSSGISGPGARSSMPANGSKVRDHLHLDYTRGTPGARTMLGFATRGTTTGGYYATANVNSQHIQVTVGNRGWSGRVYDVTGATDDEGGDLGTWFEHRAIQNRNTYWDLDNIQIYSCRSAPVSRIKGSNRFGTSAQISARFASGPEVAYLVSGASFPDGLSASAPAGGRSGPVLLVQRTSIPAAVRSELIRLRPQRIVVVGGSASVSDTVLNEARQYATSGAVSRLAGANRYDTSAEVASTFTPGVPVAFVATGASFPDALTGSALAAHRGGPLLLTRPDALPASVRAVLQELAPESVVILGGTASVSAAVEQELRTLTGNKVRRISGRNRYATAALVATEFPSTVPRVYVASGTNFPDALSGSALAGSAGLPVLLAGPTSVPQPTLSWLRSADAEAAVLLGGSGALAPIVMDVVGGEVG